MFSDTPLPPEEPTGKNPPDGAILDYFLPEKAQFVKIEIVDSDGKIVTEFSSDDEETSIDTTRLAHPTYWIKPHQKVSKEAGHHRLIWDLRYQKPRGAQNSFSIAAVYKNTPSGPKGPFVHPGVYEVRLTVNENSYSESIVVRLDPRVIIANRDLQMQSELSLICYNDYHLLQSLKEGIDSIQNIPEMDEKTKTRLLELRGSGEPGDGDILYGSISESSLEKETITGLQSKLLHMLVVLQSADARPSDPAISAVDNLVIRVKEIYNKYKIIID
jgi:hypothetical protein